jgi:hypothetical protein
VISSRIAKIIAALAAACLCLLAVGIFMTRRQATAHEQPDCRLTVPNSTIDPMVFPTKDGSEALDAAIVGNADDSVVRRVISEQGGFSIPHGTSCSHVEEGPTYSKVLVTEGEFAGKTVWAPAMHTHGG